MKLSTPRLVIVLVSFLFILAVAGGSDMSGQPPSTKKLAAIGVALLVAAAVARGFGKKAIDRAAQSL